jgi:hypothetical protein
MLEIAKEIKLDVESINDMEIHIAKWHREHPDVDKSPI